MRRRLALSLVALVAASACVGLTRAGTARADGLQPTAAPLVVVAQPDGFSDGSDGTVAATPAGFSDGSDIPTPVGFSDGADGVVLDAPAAAILAS